MIISHFPCGGDAPDGPLPPQQSFASMSWKDISAVCRAGKASEYWQLGDTKSLVPDGMALTMQIIGFDHDYVNKPKEYGRETAGISLQSVELAGQASIDVSNPSNKLSWYSDDDTFHCRMRKQTLPDWYAQLSANIQDVIVPVNKMYYSMEKSKLDVVADSIWLPSVTEIFGSGGMAAEGRQYAFYAAGNSKNKYMSGQTSIIVWWTRSPVGNNVYWYYVPIDATHPSDRGVANKIGLSPCFCV